MAAIDSLLRLMTVRNAELLVIASGEVPVLRRGGAPSSLSMPALEATLVETFVGEVFSADSRAALESTSKVDTDYTSDDGQRFRAVLEKHRRGFKMTFRPLAAAGPSLLGKPPASTAAATPVAAPLSPVAVPIAAPVAASAPLSPVGAPVAAPVPMAAPLPRPADHDDIIDLGMPLPATTARAHGPSGTPGIRAVLARASDDEISDILLSAGANIRIRVSGELREVPNTMCTDQEILSLLTGVMRKQDFDQLDRHGSIDAALDFTPEGGLRYRVSLFRQQGGMAAALRPIRTQVPTLAELGLPARLGELTRFPHGLVIITGPTGSGKSTTLVALIEEVNRRAAKHLITIEDPIEYRYRSQHSLIHQREVGRHVESFAAGLRASLRESPDIILVGEMRDRETAAAALTAAETGHLVLSTLHTSGAAQAIDRIIDLFPSARQQQVRLQLAHSLRAVLTQFLLPSTRGEPARVPAYELLQVTSAVSNQIREGKIYQIPDLILTGRNEGMVPLVRTLARMVQSGDVTFEAASAVAPDPAYLREVIRLGGI